jgi:hypothetical protein
MMIPMNLIKARKDPKVSLGLVINSTKVKNSFTLHMLS